MVVPAQWHQHVVGMAETISGRISALGPRCVVTDSGHDEQGARDAMDRVVSLSPQVLVLMDRSPAKSFGVPHTLTSGEVFRWTYGGFSCWGMLCHSLSDVVTAPHEMGRVSQCLDKVVPLCNRNWMDGIEIRRSTLNEVFRDSRGRLVSNDLETDGLTPHPGGVLTAGFAWMDGDVVLARYVVKPDVDRVAGWLYGGHRVFHNAKFEMKWYAPWRLGLRNTESPHLGVIPPFSDTMLRQWVVDENEPLNLDHLSVRYAGAVPYWADLPDPSEFASADVDELGVYNALDCAFTLRLFHHQEDLLTERQGVLLRDVLNPMAVVLADVELGGVAVDRAHLESFRSKVMAEIGEDEAAMRVRWPDVNWSSPKQVREVLFGELGLKPTRFSEVTGEASADSETLDELVAGCPDLVPVVRLRRNRTKVTRILDVMEGASRSDGFLRTNLNMGFVVTGRLSSSSPNLQNLERSGEEKACLVSQFRGGKLICADYGQFELRLCAMHARDREFRRIMVEERGDPHTETANLLNVDRQLGKRINLSLASGVSALGLHHEFGIPVERAKSLFTAWFQAHPDIERFHRSLSDTAARYGTSEDMFGRVRHLPHACSPDWKVAIRGRRQAKNFPIQGGGANMMFSAMVRLYVELRRRNAKSRIVLQVHDEMVVDVHPSELWYVPDLVRLVMEHPCDEDLLYVPLTVDVHVGDSMLKY